MGRIISSAEIPITADFIALLQIDRLMFPI